MIVGIDASNIRSGGGVTHLKELLHSANPYAHGFEKVIVFGGSSTLEKIENQDWLKKHYDRILDQGLLSRLFWQRFRLKKLAKKAKCDVLFVPGGFDISGFQPIVTMSQNLLPFEWREMIRFGWSFTTLRFLLLRYTQSRNFRRAAGLIFLTEYAKKIVLQVTGKIDNKTVVIPHGLNPRFQIHPKEQNFISEYSERNPYRLLYVSIVNEYKHQWHVVEAVSSLRAEGFSVVIDLVGPSYPSALVRLQTVLARLDPKGDWAHYSGEIPYDELHYIYANADIGIFASSCENLPITLLETMAAGLPIVCSNRGPMPEVLGDAGLYFDPENPEDIAHAIRKFILDPELRAQKSQASFERCQQYSWERCAHHTFAFFATIAHEYPEEVIC